MSTAVVVLGDALESESIHEELATRVDRGVERFEETDAAALVVTGGAPSDVDRTEASVMADYAVEQGVDRADVVEEGRSLDTVGNAYFTRHLLEGRDDLAVDRIDLVTSDWHADRSAFVFERTFGDEYDVSVGARPDAPDPRDPAEEAASFDLVREFFAPLEDGDLEGVHDRMVETHDLYEAEDLHRRLVDRFEGGETDERSGGRAEGRDGRKE